MESDDLFFPNLEKCNLHYLTAILCCIFSFLLVPTCVATAEPVQISYTDTTKENTAAVQILSKAITYKTISATNESGGMLSEFTALHAYLGKAFPELHSQLKQEVINEYSLLYTWPGRNEQLNPILISAHMDVVPVEQASKEAWQQDPFSGSLENGYVWGRGTLDDKYRVVAIMAAVEKLIKQGYEPDRTIYLAFGHDEEIGGFAGAGKISEYLENQNVKLEAVFDEGLAVVQNVLPGVVDPIAFVGTASKGYLSLELTVNGDGGHSSVPAGDTPIEVLSQALVKLQENPFKAKMTPVTRETVSLLANELGGKYKFAYRHYNIFKKKILKMLAKDPSTDALIRTKMVPTIITAGDKDNIIPRVASVVINFRIINGESDKTVLKHVQRAIHDERVQISTYGVYTPPSQITSTDSWTYKALQLTVKETFPSAKVVPALFPGATDSKHYANLTNKIFRFAPQVVDRETAQLVHNVNERLSLDVFDKCISFYFNLIHNTCTTERKQEIVKEKEPILQLGISGQ